MANSSYCAYNSWPTHETSYGNNSGQQPFPPSNNNSAGSVLENLLKLNKSPSAQQQQSSCSYLQTPPYTPNSNCDRTSPLLTPKSVGAQESITQQKSEPAQKRPRYPTYPGYGTGVNGYAGFDHTQNFARYSEQLPVVAEAEKQEEDAKVSATPEFAWMKSNFSNCKYKTAFSDFVE